MVEKKKRRQHGLWDSPIAPISLAQENSFGQIDWDQNGTLVYLENRSDRSILIVQPSDGQAARDLNSSFSVRARVGYGGGDFTVGFGRVYFVDSASGRIFRQALSGGQAHPITPAFGAASTPRLSPDGRWLLFIHTYESRDCLAIVDVEGKFWPQRIVSGDDFYMQPAWHPNGQSIAWIAWNCPNMPWDGTTLYQAQLSFPLNSLPVINSTDKIAGDENTAIFQPAFSPDGQSLVYASDESDYWQLYIHNLASGKRDQLTHAPAEHAMPAWLQGLRTFGFSPDGQRLYFVRNQQAFHSLWQLDLSTGEENRLLLEDGITGLENISVAPSQPREGMDCIALVASGGALPKRVITIQNDTTQAGIQSAAGVWIWRRSSSEELPLTTYSLPESVEWPGMEGGKCFGLFYSAHNDQFEGLGLPPLIVHIHGGPTSQVVNVFNPRAQFFTSRGYAFLEVNYRGSTGYGRAYRNMLRSNWGICDVQDSVSGARWLVEQGLVDSTRLVIMGGSSGGFTVLKALEDYPAFFKAGICLYGVSNLFTLSYESHKFELHYNDMLIGPLPQAANQYRERSPAFFADRIRDPLAVFHGENDLVVPRSHSDEIVNSLRRRGVPHIYHVYPGEGHGFRKSETIEHFYKTTEQFLRQYVIFT